MKQDNMALVHGFLRRSFHLGGWVRRGWAALFLLSMSMVCAWPQPGHAQQPRKPEIVGLRVGFGEQKGETKYRLGHWTPIEVTLRCGTLPLTGRVEVTCYDGDGTLSRVTTASARPTQLLPGRDTSVTLFAKFGRPDYLRVTFVAPDGVHLDRTFDSVNDEDGLSVPFPLSANENLVLCIGPGVGVEDAIAYQRRESPNEVANSAVVRLTDIRQLPSRWYGYEGVSALVLSGSQPEIYGKLLENSAQLAAIEEWLERGGKLVLCVGAEGRTILDPQSPLARFAPGSFSDMVSLPRTTALESFLGPSAKPLAAIGPLQAPLLKDVQGVVLAREGEVPLIIHAPRAFGEIMFVAVDLDRRPFADWESRAEFVHKLLTGTVFSTLVRTTEDTVAYNQGVYYGIQDLVGQLRGALDQFEGVQLIPFWCVALLVFVYILLIGPGDYFLVKKVLKRMELTWITFPAIVVAVSVGAYTLAYWLKGDELRLNQADVVDVDATTGLVRGTVWANVFSPRTDSYDMGLQTHLPSGDAPSGQSVLLAWLGLPGSGMGGMDSGGRPGLFARSYQFSPDLDQMAGVPIAVWSTKSFHGRWTCSSDEFPQASLREGPNRMAQGTISNSLSVPLHACLLLYGEWAQPLGDLAPGDKAAIEPDKQSNIVALLNNHQMVHNPDRKEYIQVAPPYDVSTFDVEAIVRKMMFFQASGGQQHAHLANTFQDYLDLSRHLNLGRAVLVAQVDRPPTALVNAGVPLSGPQDRHWVFYRFVYPVVQVGVNQASPTP